MFNTNNVVFFLFMIFTFLDFSKFFLTEFDVFWFVSCLCITGCSICTSFFPESHQYSLASKLPVMFLFSLDRFCLSESEFKKQLQKPKEFFFYHFLCDSEHSLCSLRTFYKKQHQISDSDAQFYFYACPLPEVPYFLFLQISHHCIFLWLKCKLEQSTFALFDIFLIEVNFL